MHQCYHASTTDPEARLYKKAQGQETTLACLGQGLMEHRHGLVVDSRVTQATMIPVIASASCGSLYTSRSIPRGGRAPSMAGRRSIPAMRSISGNGNVSKRPLERMGLLLPCSNELVQLGFQVILSRKVGDFQPLTWETAKPLVDLIHPRAMHGPAVYNQARIRDEPRGVLWPRMGADVVAQGMKHREVRHTLAFPRCQKS